MQTVDFSFSKTNQTLFSLPFKCNNFNVNGNINKLVGERTLFLGQTFYYSKSSESRTLIL